MSEEEIIKIAGGLAPIVPFADYNDREFKPRKWSQVLDECNFKRWKRQDQSTERQELIMETEVMAYTNEEYNKYLVNPSWTRQETDELMNLSSIYHLKFFIIHDRYQYL